ncbi:hypothetical protein [Klebsiella phage phiKp_21]|nr:hypothetical protein [Klebsiella phage phiKp_21]
MSLIQLSPSNGDSLLINSGSFSTGKIIRTRNELVFYTDQYGNSTGYRWLGNLPHTINGNSPQTDGGISSTSWESYITANLYDKLKSENITLSGTAHLPTVEVSYGLPKGSLKVWTPGSTSSSSQYWLYSDGTVWGGVGVLGNEPASPFTQLHLQRDIIKYTYVVLDNGETVVNIPYNFSSVEVYVNGVLQNSTSYSVSGQNIIFTSELIKGDTVQTFLNNVPISSIDYALKSDLSPINDVIDDILNVNGYNIIGKVKSINQVRQLTPTVDRESILLESAVIGGEIINEILYYDSSDTTSLDDGYSVFVTSSGQRYKAILNDGYNPLLLLNTSSSYSDIALCINKIAIDLTKKWSDNKGVIDFCTTIKIPGSLNGKRYSISNTIYIPSFVSLKMLVDTYFDFYNTTNKDGIVVDNSYFPLLLDSTYDTSTNARPRSILLWESERKIFIGAKLILTHPSGSGRTSNAGITIGNTVSGYIDVRGCNIDNFASYGFFYGIKINPVDNYINSFSNGHCGRNNYAVAVLGDTKTNAGERFVFNNLTLADSDSDLIYVENNGFELFFNSCSLDYPTNDLVKITKNGNALIMFNQCHIEGVQGLLVNVVSANTYPKYGKKISFISCMIDIGSGQTVWNKTWFYSSVINTYVTIDKSTRVWSSTSTMNQAKTGYQSLIIAGSPANNAIVLDYQQNIEDLLDASTVILGYFNPGGENKYVISTNLYSGTVGATYSSSVSAGDQWGWYNVNGTWTYTEVDSTDGRQSISVTSDSINNTYYIMCSLPYHPLSQEKFRALGSIKINSGYTGNVLVSCGVEARSIYTMNSSTISDSVLATTYSNTIDVAAIATSNNRIDQFQGFCTPACQVNSYTNQTHPLSYVRVGLKITGFTGTISLKLPTVTSHRLLSS